MESRTPRSAKTFWIATIREGECIGCTKCIQACPVDAIIGSNKQLHTVVTHACIGCKKCISPCPVDCIDLVAVDKRPYEPKQVERRFRMRKARLENEQNESIQRYQQIKTQIKELKNKPHE